MSEKYQIIENDGSDERFIENFHKFIGVVFPSISFKKWHEMGFWDKNYRSFSITESDKIISNASISKLEIFLNGEIAKGIQIGAVGTLPEYRNQGLSREILEIILNKYRSDTDLFFLFANDSVLEYYPKFGFTRQSEFKFIKKVEKKTTSLKLEKLDLNSEKDLNLILEVLKNRRCVSKIFGAKNYLNITMWHLLNIYKNEIYYLPDVDTIVIMKENESCLNIFEIFFKSSFNLDDILNQIITSDKIEKVNLHFPPDQISYTYDEVVKYDTGLFIKGTTNLEDNHFRFPQTAIT